MSRSSAFRQQLVLGGLILGIWCLLVLAFAAQLVFTGDWPWPLAMRRTLHDWLPWSILAPAVAWLAVRFPLERRKLTLSVPVHLVACLGAVVLCEVIASSLVPRRGPPFRPAADGTISGAAPGRPLPFRPPDGDPLGEGPPLNRPPPPNRPFPPRGGQSDGQGGAFPGGPLPARPRGPRPLLASAFDRAQFNVPIYCIVVTLVQASSLYRRSQERERQAVELEGRLTQAKLQALRMQLHPHFLFNTLNAISTLVHKDARAADEMIANLSELLRAALDTTEQEIPLRQELAFLNRYLDIQQVRFGERLRIDKTIDPAALESCVPTLILQPLAENALRHGIEPQPGPGVLGIGARREGNRVLLSVSDNGAGLKVSDKPSEGIGVANTRARLQALYGENAKVVFNTSSAGGYTVTLELPYHENSHC